jgi:hypothetical protein
MASVTDFRNFVFVVGAPRCGTTTLSRFLRGHPSVSFPAIKEPHYFALNDLRGLAPAELRRRVARDYLKRFYRPQTDRWMGAEGSVTYLYRPELLEPILELWPDSRFVVALRDPLSMLPSLHRRLVYVGQESIPTFEKAWAAIPSRAAGRRIPGACHDPRLLRYEEAARFGTYVERLFAAVGRERCQVVIFDDLVRDPREQYRRLMEFSGLEPQADVDFSPQRQGKGVRLHWLQRLLKQPPRILTAGSGDELLDEHLRYRRDGSARGALGTMFSLRKRLLRWNRVARPPERLPDSLQAEICLHFQDEIAALGELLGRDFSHWLRPKGSTIALPSGEANRQVAHSAYARAFSR